MSGKKQLFKGENKMPGTSKKTLNRSIIARAMKEKGVEQAELAEFLEIHQTTLSLKLQGKNEWRLSEYIKACRYLRLNPGDILERLTSKVIRNEC